MVRKSGSGRTAGLLNINLSLLMPLPRLVRTSFMVRWLTLFRWTTNGSGKFSVICCRIILFSKLRLSNRQLLLEDKIRFIGQLPAKVYSRLSLPTTILRVWNMKIRIRIGCWPGYGRVLKISAFLSGQ